MNWMWQRAALPNARHDPSQIGKLNADLLDRLSGDLS